MSAYRHRILRPVNGLSSTKLLLQREVPDQLPTPLANACRGIARQMLDVLEIEYRDTKDPEEEVVDADGDTGMAGNLPHYANGHSR
jgi:hypothetical protein